MGRRSLANAALFLLAYLDDDKWVAAARAQFVAAQNMTDRLAALVCLSHSRTEEREQCLAEFHAQALDNKLVMDKWFAVQAGARREQVIDDVLMLDEHVDFDLHNPNRARALIAGFAMNNPVAFHAPDGRGYQYLAHKVLQLDAINPQVAARLVTPLTRWDRLIESQQTLMRAQLQRLLDSNRLSADVYELVSKSIG